MEPENDGLEDDFPFQLGDFQGSMLFFRGVIMRHESLISSELIAESYNYNSRYHH